MAHCSQRRMHPSTKINVPVRTKQRTQPAVPAFCSAARPGISHRNHSTFDKAVRMPSTRHSVTTAASERSPPRMPRKHSISRMPMEYRPRDQAMAPSPVRKRAQSECVTDEYMLLNNRPRSPSPSASSHASYEHEITALEDQVLTLEGDLVSAKVDLAVQEFDLLGLQHDNYRLQLEHAHATTVADAALAALQAQYQQALRTIQDQEQTIRRQANDLDECQAWILRHNELAQSKPHQTNDSAISGELEALEGLGCVTQSVWSSRFQSSLGRQSTWKQQQLALAQVDAMHVHVGECVHAHSLRVAEAVQVEHALLKAAVTPADGGTNLLPANATVISATQLNVKDESSQANGRTNQGQANIPLTTFDQVAVELGVLVGRYGHVQAS